MFLALSMSSYSQLGNTFNIMGALPVSEYGSDNLDEEGSGGAGMGFGLGLKYVRPLMGNGLGMFIEVDAIYNGLKGSVKDDMEEMYSQMTGGSEIDITYPKLLNFPVSLGLNFTMASEGGPGFFADLGLTYNLFKMTKTTIKAGGEEGTLKANLGTALGFRAGGGVLINEKLSVFVNYLGLGTHKFNMKIEAPGESEEYEAEQKIDIITVGVGFTF